METEAKTRPNPKSRPKRNHKQVNRAQRFLTILISTSRTFSKPKPNQENVKPTLILKL